MVTDSPDRFARVVAASTALPAGVIAAYDAPFPDDGYKAGARVFPSLVPVSPDDPAHDATT
jgi:haloalkane dehalogenase